METPTPQAGDSVLDWVLNSVWEWVPESGKRLLAGSDLVRGLDTPPPRGGGVSLKKGPAGNVPWCEPPTPGSHKASQSLMSVLRGIETGHRGPS